MPHHSGIHADFARSLFYFMTKVADDVLQKVVD
jgi:hypothetical protein